jgi:hypothetical protein
MTSKAIPFTFMESQSAGFLFNHIHFRVLVIVQETLICKTELRNDPDLQTPSSGLSFFLFFFLLSTNQLGKWWGG